MAEAAQATWPYPAEWQNYVRPSGIQPGDAVWLIRGSRGRGPGSGPGHERRVRARYLGGDAYNVVCELLEEDPVAVSAPLHKGGIGVWHGESFLAPCEESHPL